MRLDKFLKVSRIIKRRTVANEACSSSHVTVNSKISKPSTNVDVGDVIELKFGEKRVKFQVLSVAENVSKDKATEMYKIISE